MSLDNYTDKIKKLQAEIDKLSAAAAREDAMPPDERLAVQLHKMLCHWNHTDGCSWEYEFSNGQVEWHGHAHGKYLRKARCMLMFCNEHNVSVDKVIGIVKLMNE